MDRGDGKRPDGVTVYPYKNGKSMCWDATCIDTFAVSHMNDSSMTAGTAASAAEMRKRVKYEGLTQRFIFEPIAVETSGVYGRSTATIVSEIGKRLVRATGDPRESLWFEQRLGLAIVRGNAFSILSSTREL